MLPESKSREFSNSLYQYITVDIKKMIGMLIWFWQELVSAKGRRLMKQMFLCIIAHSVITIYQPMCFSYMVDAIQNKSTQQISNWMIVFFILLILGELLAHLNGAVREYAFEESLRQLNVRTSELFFEKSLLTHVSSNNELNEPNIKKGFEKVVHLSNLICFEIPTTLIEVLFPMIALWFLNIWIGLGATIMFIFHLVVSFWLNMHTMKSMEPVEASFRQLEKYRVERWTMIERVKTNAKEDHEIMTIRSMFDKAAEPDVAYWIWFRKQVTRRGFVIWIFVTGLLTLALHESYAGLMSIGMCIPILMWLIKLAGNMWRIGNIEEQINRMTFSIISMKEALNLDKGIIAPENAIQITDDSTCQIEFKGTCFSFDGKRNTISDVNLLIPQGTRVALTGPTGAGKSTLIKMIMRFMNPTAGAIYVDGHDLTQIDTSSWLKRIGYIPQQAEIFAGTLRYNLIYGMSDEQRAALSDEELWKQVLRFFKNAKHRFINQLDTEIGHDGILLSGGERQRVMILAALLKKPKIFVVDEATSSLDAQTEADVQEAIDDALGTNNSALIISHRLCTIRNCDLIVVLGPDENGITRIEAIGRSFEEVAEQSAWFRKSAETQGLLPATAGAHS